MRNIDRQIERYLVVRVVISAIVAVATGVATGLLGLHHAVVWGIVAGVLNVLPFVGPSVAVALITLAAFLQFKEVGATLANGGAALAVAALEGNLISPVLTGRAGELNTVTVFVSVLVWGWLWDVWGLLLAVPIMVAVKAAADHIEGLRPLGELLGR
jgi:predicted PurR-regulated permease PerM